LRAIHEQFRGGEPRVAVAEAALIVGRRSFVPVSAGVGDRIALEKHHVTVRKEASIAAGTGSGRGSEPKAGESRQGPTLWRWFSGTYADRSGSSLKEGAAYVVGIVASAGWKLKPMCGICSLAQAASSSQKGRARSPLRAALVGRRTMVWIQRRAEDCTPYLLQSIFPSLMHSCSSRSISSALHSAFPRAAT